MIDFAPVTTEEAPPGAEVMWQPNPGRDGERNPQEVALCSSADEIFYGGAKGGAKTETLLMKPLRLVHKPAFACAFVRETFPELQRPLDRATQLYGRLPLSRRPAWNGEKHRFTFPSRAFVQFGHARTVKEIGWTQGGNWAMICCDEQGNQPDEKVTDTLISELRCPDPTIQTQFIGSGNPGFAGHPVIKRRYITPCGKRGERIAWRAVRLPDGRVVYRSRQFIPARVTDNPTYANDAAYMAALMLLPDRMKRCLMDGDWDAATGVALDELEPAVHLVPAFDCPDHWPFWASFDWGFAHNAVFGWGRVSEDGRLYVCDTIKRRLLRDWDLASTYNTLVPAEALKNVQAGHDCWQEVKAKGQNAPATADYFHAQGIHLAKANIDRAQGYNTLMQFLAWRETEFLPQRQPMLQWMDTPGNRWMVEEHLPTMVMDPDDPRDVLKVNADPETGEGGDDGYDQIRYGVARRKLAAPSTAHLVQRSAWDPDVLRRAAEQLMRPQTTPVRTKKDGVFFGG